MKRPGEALPADCLAALAGRHGLSEGQSRQLGDFLTGLTRDPHAPTAVRDPREALDVHLADSLAGLPALDAAVDRGVTTRVADIGSGAGLPGIPLAISRPAVSFDLVEATRRKCAFLATVVDRLGLENVTVHCTRVEELPGEVARESYGVVLARAVSSLATLLEYAAPLLEQGGELIAWKGRRDPGEEAAAEAAGRQLGLEPVTVQAVTPYEQSRNRHLNLYRKVRPCPAGFPRRPGMAQRRPLGAS